MATTDIKNFQVPAAKTPAADTPLYLVQEWCLLSVSKETSGAVVLGTDADLYPMVGRGFAIPADTFVTFLAAPDTKLYAVRDPAGTDQRIAIIVQPLPFLVGAMTLLDAITQLLGGRGLAAVQQAKGALYPTPSTHPRGR